jgi:superfamily I DNA/RNA helicase
MLSIVAQQDTHAQLIYVGDTQQQIYGWRGAINALDSLDDAERTWLTQSFRFGPAIAEIANDCLEQIEAPLRLQGLETLASVVEPIDMPRATLCRTNAEAVGRVISALQAGRRPYLVGEGVEVVRFARAVEQLRETGSTSHPELACFTSWGQVQDYVDQDPQGSDLALLVRLVEQFGTETIISALSNPRPEESCDEVVSTAHKAKGREWETVTLAGDFPEPTERELTTEEWRLLYVAVTRAQLGLDISGVAALTGSMPGRVDVEVPDTLPVADAADARMDEAYGYRRPPLG